MKSTAQEHAQTMTAAQLREQGAVLAAEIIDQVLRPKEPQMRTVVVMEALILLYRFHAQMLPPEAMGLCSMALASVAGDLLKASAALQTVPAGASIH